MVTFALVKDEKSLDHTGSRGIGKPFATRQEP
jgi:hypothetical protein